MKTLIATAGLILSFLIPQPGFAMGTNADAFFFYPQIRTESENPSHWGHRFKEVMFDARDGIHLNAWWVQGERSSGESSRGLVIYMHGNAGNMYTHYSSVAWLVEGGFDLFMFDYRGFGLSDGKATRRGAHRDSLAALTTARNLYLESGGTGPVILVGHSLGGIISMRAMLDWHIDSDFIDGQVVMSSFSSYKKIALYKVPLLGAAVKDELAVRKSLRQLYKPMLIAHGEEDEVIPPKFSEEIYEKVSSADKEYVLVRGATHMSIFTDAGFRKDLVQWMSRQTHTSP